MKLDKAIEEVQRAEEELAGELVKIAAVRVEKLADANGVAAPAPATTASEPVGAGARRR